jgi:hypothetical protein
LDPWNSFGIRSVDTLQMLQQFVIAVITVALCTVSVWRLGKLTPWAESLMQRHTIIVLKLHVSTYIEAILRVFMLLHSFCRSCSCPGINRLKPKLV